MDIIGIFPKYLEILYKLLLAFNTSTKGPLCACARSGEVTTNRCDRQIEATSTHVHSTKTSSAPFPRGQLPINTPATRFKLKVL